MPPNPHSLRATVLTAGNRLARHLLDEHARAMLAQGIEAWETPDILTWSVWLEQLWDEAIESGALGRHPPLRLGDGQALALWESIIGDWAGDQALLQPSATAELAHEAWQRMHEWRVPDGIDSSGESATATSLSRGPRLDSGMESRATAQGRAGSGFDPIGDSRAFAGWSVKYREACERHHWLDGARLVDALIPLVRARRLALPATVALRGFDTFTPAQQAMIEALREAGVTVDAAEPPAPTAGASRVVLPTLREEVDAAACFARARLQANPRARIGIVVPDLARHRELVCRVFDERLAPDSRLPGGTRRPRPYNLSLGRSLAETSPVAEALALLADSISMQRTGTLGIEAARAWLRSPYLDGAAEEWAARARLERHLQASREPQASVRFLLHGAEARARDLEECPRLAARLNDWRQRLSQLPARDLPSRWVPVVTELLQAAGWPGDRTRDSHEHQAMQHWRDLLGELRRYDAVTGAIVFEAVVARVQTLARAAIFQPQMPMVPVQILGLLETSGLQFDHLWVLGLQDENWPASPRPHPFIPVAVQRRLGMPHATPERELVYARERTARLMAAAPEVVFSSAHREGDRQLAPSPLLIDLPERPPESPDNAAPPRHVELIHRRARVEGWRDERAPALETAEAAGGTRLFQLQSACPFRAFAEIRLHAAALPSQEVGLDAAERGTLVHRALEKIWASLTDQATLAGLDLPARAARVHDAVDDVLDHARRRRPFTFTERFRELERERLAILLDEWLALERQRPPFQVIASETGRPLAVGPLTVEGRLDRLDRFADGTLAVTDYKTGKPSTADWFGARPREPQLPLYALYGAGEPVAALVYAQVKRGQCQWRGISAHDTDMPGVKRLDEAGTGFVSWDELRQHWRQVLEGLARAFRDGQAPVDPRAPEDCRHCHLPPLCRVHERDHRAGRLRVEDGGDD